MTSLQHVLATTSLVATVVLGGVTAHAQSRGGSSAAPAQAAPSVSVPSSSGTTGLKGLRPVASPRVVTLDEAFAQAVSQSFDLRIAAARIDEANAHVRQAWSAVLPQVSLSGQYAYNFPDQSFAFGDAKQFQQQALLFNSIADLTSAQAAQLPDPVQQRAALERAEQLRQTAKDIGSQKPTNIQITPTHELDGQITLSMPLFNGRALPLLQNAYAGVDVSKIATRSARAAIVFGTARAYYGVVATKRIVDIASQQVDSATKHADLAAQRKEEGVGTALTVQRAELDLARAQQSKSQALGALKMAKGALGSLIGVVDDFDVAEPAPVKAIEQGASVDDLYARALSSRDDLRIQKQSLAIADRGKADAWMRFLPSLALAAVGRGTSNTGGLVSSPFTGQVAVQASVPIYDGGYTYGALDEADAKLRQELLKVRQLEQSIEEEVRGTYDDLELKRNAVELATHVADLAHAQKAQVDDLFAAGAATGLDVTDASLAAFSSDVDLARARFDVETARLGLAYSVGELRPDADVDAAPLSDDEEKKARAFVDNVADE